MGDFDADLIDVVRAYEQGKIYYQRLRGGWGWFLDAESGKITPPPVIQSDSEIEAFRARIATSPLDPLNHLVLADFLRDRNRELEADFHSGIGQWLQSGVYAANRGSRTCSLRFPLQLPLSLRKNDLLGSKNSFKFHYLNRAGGDLLPRIRTRNGSRELHWQTFTTMEHSFFLSYFLKRYYSLADPTFAERVAA
ncbi:unnamed protein product [Gemmata massiliana]|uniref:Uncharacterized protein n=1 Tax=Gemmata massiliana TaxID=1210884 RepID=A0A6P2CYD2_9BACT|nr:hypothetical protein [Gemmata massiliana]VTR92142.1 unnamed protein product [Gemmata massiliana]